MPRSLPESWYAPSELDSDKPGALARDTELSDLEAVTVPCMDNNDTVQDLKLEVDIAQADPLANSSGEGVNYKTVSWWSALFYTSDRG